MSSWLKSRRQRPYFILLAAAQQTRRKWQLQRLLNLKATVMYRNHNYQLGENLALRSVGSVCSVCSVCSSEWIIHRWLCSSFNVKSFDFIPHRFDPGNEEALDMSLPNKNDVTAFAKAANPLVSVWSLQVSSGWQLSQLIRHRDLQGQSLCG